jgi:hypothetical protein
MFSATLGLEYHNPSVFFAQLFGRYESWDLPDEYGSKDSDMIWELNFHRRLFRIHQTATQVFFTVHNLFSGAQYAVGVYPNPPRWVEGSLRCYF